jgi:hypothetical protein
LKVDRRSIAMLRTAKTVWQSFQPLCSVWGGRVTTVDFTFEVTRMLDAGAKIRWHVNAWRIDDGNCSLGVKMALYDERVSNLRSIAVGYDVTSLSFLSFDVLAASSVMDEQEVPAPPVMASERSVEEFASLAQEYTTRIDRIWEFVGGLSVAGMERLAIWAIRNRRPA